MGRRWLSAQTPTWTQQATTVSERSQLGDTVLILANPHAGSGRRHRLVQHLIDALDARGVRSVRVGTVAELAERGAELMAAGQLRCLVAAGGDGTVQAVLNHGPRSVPLVPLALGTENLLARYLKCGFQIGPLAEAIDACQSRRVDVGEVIDQTGKRRRFLLMFSCGFDAAVIAELDRGREGPIQHASYLRPIVRSLRDYPYPKIAVSILERDGQHVAGQAEFVWLFNAPSYALCLPICPEADPGDGRLDLVMMRANSFWQLLFRAGRLIVQRRAPAEVFQRAERFHVAAAESCDQVPWQIDGEAGGELPVDISVLPSAAILIVPPNVQNQSASPVDKRD